MTPTELVIMSKFVFIAAMAMFIGMASDSILDGQPVGVTVMFAIFAIIALCGAIWV